jgi:hypothetical protein
VTHRVVKAVRQNFVAWLALFVALGGTSLASSRYLVNSTKQINPKVLKKLKGKGGPRGATGAAGAAGVPGAHGEPGPRGEVGPQGPGATTFTATLAQAEGEGTIIATLANGLLIRGYCKVSEVGIMIEMVSRSSTSFELSGTASKPGTGVVPVNLSDTSFGTVEYDTTEVDWDAIARDSAVGPFVHIDAYGHHGATCSFRGMITPSR